jgi:hypothetical protein
MPTYYGQAKISLTGTDANIASAMYEQEIVRAARWLTVWNVCLVGSAALTAISTFFAIHYSDELQALKDKELSRFQVEAQRDIAHANEKAQDAIKGQRQLEAETEQARLKQREAERATTELQLRVEQEKLARVQIEERLADRYISPEQTARLVQDLKPLHGKKLAIAFISGVPETSKFSTILATKLRNAGMSVDAPVPMLLLGNVSPGIAMVIGQNRLSDAEILGIALVNAGLASKPVPAQKDENNAETLQLTVGPKN